MYRRLALNRHSALQHRLDRGASAPGGRHGLRSGMVAWVSAAVLLIGGVAVAAPGNGNGNAHGVNGTAPGQAANSSAQGGGSGGGQGLDHDGDADRSTSTNFTEDNDTNDGVPNNIPDAGDNMHPTGKDRSVENGNSANQGNAESHPDDSKGPMRYEGELGPDKPNGPGGTDLADQDGNNGCGNDDDFDDDNNGWCGKKRDRTPPTNPPPNNPPPNNPPPNNPPPGGGGQTSTGGTTPPVIVAGVSTTRPPSGQSLAQPEVRVLGVQMHRAQADAGPALQVPQPLAVAPQVLASGGSRPDVLPRTGIDASTLLLTALSLMGFGWVISRRGPDLRWEEPQGFVIDYQS